MKGIGRSLLPYIIKDSHKMYLPENVLDFFDDRAYLNPTDVFILAEMLHKINATSPRSLNCVGVPMFHWVRPSILLSPVQLDFSSQELFLGVRWQQFKIITCYREVGLSFEFYQNPFDNSLWLAIFATLVILAVALNLFVHLLKNEKTHFSSSMYLLSSVFGHSFKVPDHIEQSKSIRFTIVPWLVACVILGNCYTGLVISDLNSPAIGNKILNFSI